MPKHTPRKPAVDGNIASDGRTNRERTRHYLMQFYRHARDACKLAADFKTATGCAMPDTKIGWMTLAAEYGFPRWGDDDAYDEGAIYAWVLGRARAAPVAPDALHPNHLRLLRALNERGATMGQQDLMTASDLSRGTVGRLLKRLRELGLVDRPMGDRSGHAITSKGRLAVGAQ